MTPHVPVALEITDRRVFARALEWPGWCRSGRTEADALERLAAYARRYGAIVAGGPFSAVRDGEAFDVVERVDGNATTSFGAPGVPVTADEAAVDEAELDRLIQILQACWAAFDRAVEDARGVELRKGPRGGGRELDRIVEHVREAEKGYLGQLGARPPRGEDSPLLRDAVVATMRAVATGADIPNPRATKRPWPLRYFAHRAAWHVLDHAWEIEDRST